MPLFASEVFEPLAVLGVCFLFMKCDAFFSSEVVQPLACFGVYFLFVKRDASFSIGGL
jgi:hypothetical protein